MRAPPLLFILCPLQNIMQPLKDSIIKLAAMDKIAAPTKRLAILQVRGSELLVYCLLVGHLCPSIWPEGEGWDWGILPWVRQSGPASLSARPPKEDRSAIATPTLTYNGLLHAGPPLQAD